MPPRSRPPDDERNELLLRELEHIRETITRLETAVIAQASNLDTVRIAELSAIRANLNDVSEKLTARISGQDAELKLLRYQQGRTAATWSLVSSGVASAIVAAVMALLLHRGG